MKQHLVSLFKDPRLSREAPDVHTLRYLDMRNASWSSSLVPSHCQRAGTLHGRNRIWASIQCFLCNVFVFLSLQPRGFGQLRQHNLCFSTFFSGKKASQPAVSGQSQRFTSFLHTSLRTPFTLQLSLSSRPKEPSKTPRRLF